LPEEYLYSNASYYEIGMKQIIYIFVFFILTGCQQSNSEDSTTVSDTSITNKKEVSNILSKEENKSIDDKSDDEVRPNFLTGFEKATVYELTDTIAADFNGDGITDKAFLKIENETSGIIIQHGKTNELVRIGFGKSFGSWKDFDCNWVNHWALVEDKETSETIVGEDGDIAGSQKVELQNPSILLEADEVGGGLITFKNGKYVWVHQTC